MDPCKIASFSPERIPQLNQAGSETEHFQLNSPKSSLQKKTLKDSSSKAFLRKAKETTTPQRMGTTVNLPEYLTEIRKRSPLDRITPGHKTGENCLEEISTEFTSVTSVHSYEVNINKAPKYCFRKLGDGTFSIERKPTEVEQKNQEPSQSDATKKLKPKMTGPYTGRYAYRPLKICFKKRSKTFKKALEAKDEHQADYVTLKQANHLSLETEQSSDAGINARRSQASEGTWATIKSLVKLRKRFSSSSKMHSYSDSRVHVEAKAGTAGIQRFTRRKPSARLKIPCIQFSRDKKKSGHVERTDEKYRTVTWNEMKDIMSETEANQDETALMMKSNPQQSLSGTLLDKKSGYIGEQVGNAIRCTAKSPEKLEAGRDRPADDAKLEVLAGIINGKHTQRKPQEYRNIAESRVFSVSVLNGKEAVGKVFTGQEKNAISDEGETCPGPIKFQTARPDLPSCSLKQRKLEDSKASTERPAMCKDTKMHPENRAAANEQVPIPPAHEAQSSETTKTGSSPRTSRMSQPQVVMSSDGAETEELKPVSAREPSGGEAWERDAGPGNVLPPRRPTYHSIRTADPHETLLMKAAASLVKSVIQSSIEQVIDEMSFDSSYPSNILQS